MHMSASTLPARLSTVLHTNSPDNRSTTEILVWTVLDIEICAPFKLCPVGQVIQSVRHLVVVMAEEIVLGGRGWIVRRYL